jgi:hypothetical protein
MLESRLDQCLKVFSERSLRSLTDDFNAATWSRILEKNAVIIGASSFHRLVAGFASPPRAIAGLATALLVSSTLWFSLAGSEKPSAKTVSAISGEVVDLACYFQDAASGPEHAACARRCIESGLPVGIKTRSGKTYLLLGLQQTIDQDGARYESLNQRLAQYAAKVVKIRGQIVEKEGLSVIENVQLLVQ